MITEYSTGKNMSYVGQGVEKQPYATAFATPAFLRMADVVRITALLLSGCTRPLLPPGHWPSPYLISKEVQLHEPREADTVWPDRTPGPGAQGLSEGCIVG